MTKEQEDPFTLQKRGIPYVLSARVDADLPLTASKLDIPDDQIMVCFEGACQLPTNDWDVAAKQVYQRDSMDNNSSNQE